MNNNKKFANEIIISIKEKGACRRPFLLLKTNRIIDE